jgi:hypothetical protein
LFLFCLLSCVFCPAFERPVSWEACVVGFQLFFCWLLAAGCWLTAACLQASKLPLHTIKANANSFEIGHSLRIGQSKNGQLHHKALLSTIPKLEKSGREYVDGAEHFAARDSGGPLSPVFDRFCGCVHDLIDIGGVLSQEDATEISDGVGDESTEIRTPGGELGDKGDTSSGIAICDKVE